ncbi:hypothetical protein [Nonomuraea dietziae]|uniref:hypothetical protein n=1 Tax=Nonomuraea dietziae TaxID=65515 RepID=UPI0031DF9C33
MRDSTRQRVLEAARELAFQPNELASRAAVRPDPHRGAAHLRQCGQFGIPVLLGAEDAFGAGEMAVLLCDARGDAIRDAAPSEWRCSRAGSTG